MVVLLWQLQCFCYISNLVKFDIWKHLNIPYFMTALFTQTKSKDGLMDATLHMKKIAELDLPGYAIGGLAVGETHQEMYDTIEAVEEYMPKDKPRYLMGVGTPANILEGVSRGVDLFDCVMPSRNARHGHLFTWDGIININNEKYKDDMSPIDERCGCPACRKHSRAYIRHLIRSGEMLGQRLSVEHNLYFYNTLMEKIRENLDAGTFESFKNENIVNLSTRI